MFGFLNSTVLLAAAAALIPLLIHLFSRRRVKVVEFSSLKHLKEMQKRQLRRLKIRQWLLLLLRMLIVLAAVLAFARPTSRQSEVGSHAAVTAVVLFDNSASMDRQVADGILLDIARQRTVELLETMSPSDRVAVLELDRSIGNEGRALTSSAVALEQVSRLRRGGGRADLQSGWEKAVALLNEASDLNRELYYVGDLQQGSLPDEDPTGDLDFPLYMLELPSEADDNLGLVAVDFGGQLLHAGHEFDLTATVHNHGRAASGERIASLYIDGKRVAQTDFEVAGDGETTVRFQRTVSTTGFHSGYVELSEDRLAADNKYFFSFRIPEQFNLLIIDGDPITEFVNLALEPPGSGSRYWSTKLAQPDELAGVNFYEYQVVMLAGVPTLEPAQVRRLESFLQRGGALVLTYGGQTDIDNFNRVWSRTSGVRYEQAARTSFSRAGYFSFDQYAAEHPIFQPFAFGESGLPPVKFYTLPEYEVSPEAAVLLGFTGDRPALVENGAGLGRVMTFAGPMASEYSDLTSHGFFVPFMARLMEYLASDLSSLETNLTAGVSLSRALPEQNGPIYAVEMLAPDSSVTMLTPEDSDNLQLVRTGPIEREGIYSLHHRGREIDRFAVNLDPDEGDLRAVDPEQLAASLGADDLRPVAFEAPLAATISDFRIGRELWQLFLWAAVVLLAVEMLVGRRNSEE